jgi:hypothetical protein
MRQQIQIVWILKVIFVFTATSLFATPVISDQDWVSMNDYGVAGTNGPVRALIMDKDSNLYIAGKFTVAGKIVANNIVKWDGIKWTALGSGCNGMVYALAIDSNGALYAGGEFSVAGGNDVKYVAKWNGTAWSALGAGLNSTVYALTFDRSGSLFAGGAFTSANGVTVNHVAQWNGTAWSALGTGTNGNVYSFLLDTTGELYVGGSFTMIGKDSVKALAIWNGVSWTNCKLAISKVSAMTMDKKGLMYVTSGYGGYIRKGKETSWAGIGNNYLEFLGRDMVNCVACDTACVLHVAGSFYTANGSACYNKAKLEITNAAYWVPDQGFGTTKDTIYSMIFGETCSNYNAGVFNNYGGSNIGGITRVSPGFRSCLNASVNCLAFNADGKLIVGGDFTATSTEKASHLALWNGTNWASFGSGANGPVKSIVYGNDGKLFVAGVFDSVGSTKAKNIAQWNGSGWNAMGAGLNQWVITMVTDQSGNLFAGGYFDTADNQPAKHIAKWDGAKWSQLGTGVQGFIYALAVDNKGSLFAGGTAYWSDGINGIANNIAQWNGSKWDSLGSGTNRTVNCVISDNKGKLYAGGEFTIAGGVKARYIAQWDGKKWDSLGTGLDSLVSAIALDSNGNLYAAGIFEQAGNVVAHHIALWDGINWSAMGTSAVRDYSGRGGWVSALEVRDNVLYVTGNFDSAGGKTSPYVANINLNSSVVKDHSKPIQAVSASVHYHVWNSSLHLFNLDPQDNVFLYSLDGRCKLNAQGTSYLDLKGLASQLLVIRIVRNGKSYLTGRLVVSP